MVDQPGLGSRFAGKPGGWFVAFRVLTVADALSCALRGIRR